MVSVEEIQAHHVFGIKPQEMQKDEHKVVVDMLRRYGIAIVNNPWFDSFGYALVDGHKVLAIFGNTREWAGKDRVWTIIAEDISRGQWIALWRYAKKWIDGLRKGGTWRVEADVRADFKEGIRAAEMFGFKNEGLMLKYNSTGKDCYRYSIIWAAH